MRSRFYSLYLYGMKTLNALFFILLISLLAACMKIDTKPQIPKNAILNNSIWICYVKGTEDKVNALLQFYSDSFALQTFDTIQTSFDPIELQKHSSTYHQGPFKFVSDGSLTLHSKLFAKSVQLNLLNSQAIDSSFSYKIEIDTSGFYPMLYRFEKGQRIHWGDAWMWRGK